VGLLLLAGIVVVALGVAGAAFLAVRIRRDYARSNEVVPGRSTSAPPAWAGAHSPEARLHRRLIAAVAALRAHPLLEEGTGRLEARVSLEEAAVAIDEQLVAVAALPDQVRAEPLARIEEQVGEIERAVAAVAAGGETTVDRAIEQQAADLSRQLDDLTQIRADLESPPPAPAPAPAPAPTNEPRAEPG